jgi:type 1 glutamine amidotransferase
MTHRHRILYLLGGWPGHIPYESRSWTYSVLEGIDADVVEVNDPFVLESEKLTDYDLIILGWNNALTTEDLTDRQEDRLLDAVAEGTSIVAWHGAGAAFRSSLKYHWLVGGSFIEHPGGEGFPYPYRVEIVDRDHPVSSGVADFDVASEQYYMHVDPANHVLAETEFAGDIIPWLDGVRVPVVWVRQWGKGRVYYNSIGHSLTELNIPENTELTRQGFRWALRLTDD